jgi:hypothetical protein
MLSPTYSTDSAGAGVPTYNRIDFIEISEYILEKIMRYEMHVFHFKG